MAEAASGDAGLDLSGKAVVVTGGGRGLGEAVCKAVAAAGASVIVNDVDAGPAQACVAAITAAGGRAVAHVADIAVWRQAEGVVERCLDEFGRIDGLVNNAGIARSARTWQVEEANVRATLEIHVMGTIACTSRALKAMLAQGSGSIVNTTSGAAMGADYRPDYAAAKGAISSFTYTAAIEVAGTGVRVNAMAPFVMSRMYDEFDELMKREHGGWNPAPMPPPETNTGIHLYLLSDRSRQVNGQVIGIRHDGELYIASHPAALEPTVTRQNWSAQAIAEAIEGGQLAPFQALGFARLRATPGRAGGFTGKLAEPVS
jgi:NAD(P)-dependent dehydrogenase (short-subunit alcohol dehydrogenase family)